MANIAISELDTETTSLGDNDLLLVSKDNGGSYTSAKMKGSVLKSGVSGCQFSEDAVKNTLTGYNVANIDNIATINEKLDSLATVLDDLSIKQTENFQLLIDLDTRIGNKIFGQEGGEISPTEEYTLTLNKYTGGYFDDKINDPVGGGIYKKGTRVIITADSAAQSSQNSYKFDGWYNGNVLISTNSTYSWEVTGDVTLTAKYSYDAHYRYFYFTVDNNSNYDICLSNNWHDAKMGYCSIIESGKMVVAARCRDIYFGNDTRFSGLEIITQNLEDNEKIKISIDPDFGQPKNWGEAYHLTKNLLYWFLPWRSESLPNESSSEIIVISNA